MPDRSRPAAVSRRRPARQGRRREPPACPCRACRHGPGAAAERDHDQPLAGRLAQGRHYDLPIALALLAAMGVTDTEQLADWVAVGELALDGRIAPSPGVLLAALHASEAEKGLICPAGQGAEARWASGIPVTAAPNL